MRREFLLDALAVVAAGAGKVLLGVRQFVRIETQLRLGHVQIACAIAGRHGGLGRFGEKIHASLVVVNGLLDPRGLLRKGQRVAGQSVALHAGLAQSRREGLVHFMVGVALGRARVLGFLRRDGQRGQGLRGLPGTQIHQGVLAAAGTHRLARPREKRQMDHGVARVPGDRQAQDQRPQQAQQEPDPDLAEDA